MGHLLLTSVLCIILFEVDKRRRRKRVMKLIQIITRACKAETFEELNKCHDELRKIGRQHNAKDVVATSDLIILLGEKLYKRNNDITSKIMFPCETMDLN